jgi:hypothetical protein
MNLSRDAVLVCLGNEADQIDLNDAYQVYAFINLINIVCVNCKRELDVLDIPGTMGSADWCRKVAEKIRQNGWILPPINDDQSYTLDLYCPSCKP